MDSTREEKISTWVNSLRSDEFSQGTDQLCSRDSDGIARFCCLGVYAKVVGGYTEEYLSSSQGNGGPTAVYNELNLLFGEELVDRAMTMNDAEENSFEEIADYVENYFHNENLKE